jgi:signal peptidase II
MKRHSPFLILILLLVALDHITKYFVVKNIGLHTSKVVIPGFFNLTQVQNRGAIFGFFSRSSSPWVFVVLTVLSVVAFALIIYYFFGISPSDRWMKLSLSLVLAGATGNLLDRIIRGYVIDFLDFYVKGWHWPTFNVADSCISVGAVLLFILFFFRRS